MSDSSAPPMDVQAEGTVGYEPESPFMVDGYGRLGSNGGAR